MNMMQQAAKPFIESPTEKVSRANRTHTILFAILGLFLMVAAYKCIVQKSFLGDDHVHLVWLREAVKDPSLVLRNFASNWLYAWTTPQCYRPLISVFMYTDYLIWHKNAVGFHITNLVFLTLSCAALYGCVLEISKWSKQDNLRLWPVFAACTFALYPSHPEAVSWVTGRVDAIVTAFYLASVYFWMLWRRTGKRAAFAGSIISMLLSLASKEMGVTIPVALFLYEFFRPQDQKSTQEGKAPTDGGTKLLFKNTLRCFASTAVAWGVLGAYFVLRRVTLGTFVGGYDDTLAVNWHLLASNWISGLHKFFVPINFYYEQNQRFLISAWTVLTAAVYAVPLVESFRKAHRNQLLFLLGFAAVSFVPVYKLFTGMPDLQGSRFSFLASAPIAALFAFGLAYFPQLIKLPKGSIASATRAATAVIYFCIAAYMLWLNNQPWMTAGKWVSTMETQFRQILDNASSNDHFIFFNIPNNYRGAYLARNAVGDMGGHPNLDWRAIEQTDKMGELGQSREAIANHTKHLTCFYWSETAAAFIPVTLPPKQLQDLSDWNALPLTDKLKVISGADRVQVTSHELVVKPGSSVAMVVVEPDKLTPWQIELLELKFGKASSTTTPCLIASTDLLRPQIVPAAYPNTGAESTESQATFATRLLPGWFCATGSTNLVLQFPANWSGRVVADIPPLHTVIPTLIRTSTARYVTATSPLEFSFDVAQIPGAAGAVIEVSKKNLFFSRQNTDQTEQNLVFRTMDFNTLNAQVKMTDKDFKGSGAYQIRCWAVSKQGQRIGCSSDYILAITL
jgi:hypothetical protein